MELHDIAFFCNRENELENSPKVSFYYSPGEAYPVTLRINTEGYPSASPNITFYITKAQLTHFKNSVISSYEAMLREERSNG